MSPRKHTIDAAKGVLEIEWPFFGEMSRGLALKVARAYDPELVIGIATAGVIPGAVIAAILGREFHSLIVSRKYRQRVLVKRRRYSAARRVKLAASAFSSWTKPAIRATPFALLFPQ